MVEPAPDINPVFLNAEAPTLKRGVGITAERL
jgi:hypothetical protein